MVLEMKSMTLNQMIGLKFERQFSKISNVLFLKITTKDLKLPQISPTLG